MISNIKHLELLDALGLHDWEYVILGSASAMAHGFPKEENDDIDLFVTQDAFDRIVDRLHVVNKPNLVMYSDVSGHLDIGTSTEVFKSDPSMVFAMSCMIDNHRYLDIDGLKMFYEHLVAGYGREKHKQVLEWINNQ